MKKTTITIIGVLLTLGVYAQAPQGFNYQAVVRNDQGAPLSGQQVSIRISLQDEAGVITHYSETHSVTTSPQGVVSFVVGSGTVQNGTFANIPWAEGNIYMKIEVDPTGGNGYTTLGVSQLQSVPYALHAQTANRFEAIPGAGDEALFEVRNSEGKVVFAVYEQGVRIYVDGDPGDEDKGNRSGFAIGGLTGFKDTGEEYFRVSRGYTQVLFDDEGKSNRSGFAIGGLTGLKGGEDEKDYLNVSRNQTRVIFDDTAKGNRSGFFIGGLTGLKDGEESGASFFDVTTDATGVIDPAENRVLWYPLKNAFLAGRVLVESSDNVGENSFAVGYESKGKGKYSQAMGFQAQALGNYSTAIGNKAKAHQINSFAFGEDAEAVGEESYAIGRGASATGYRSFAIGSAGIDTLGNASEPPQAIGNYSFALGQGAKAVGEGAFSMGLTANAIGNYSIAIGRNSKASDRYGIAIGWHSVAANAATAIGYNALATGSSAISIGSVTNASGAVSTALGNSTKASGDFSTAMGYFTKALGEYSTAMGYFTNASGKFSTAMGMSTEASKIASVSMGYLTIASGEYSTAMGYGTEASGYSSAAIGENTVASGARSTAMGYDTQSTSYYSTAMGYSTVASGNSSTAMGGGSKASASYSSALGFYTIANTLAMTAIGQYNWFGADNAGGWLATDPIFVIGIGNNSSDRKNAMTVLKNGRIGLQSVTAPTYALELPNSAEEGKGSARATAWVTHSDTRIKSNQQPIHYGLAQVLLMAPKTYFQHNSTTKNGNIVIAPEGKQDIGLVAQEVYEIIPEVVSKPENEQAALWGIAYDKLVPVLIKAIQEQQEMIEGLKGEIEQMKKTMDK